MIELPMAHPEMLYAGLWIVFVGVVSAWVMKYVTTNTVLRLSLRVCIGVLFGSMALGCLSFGIFGTSIIENLFMLVAVGSLIVFVPLVLYAEIRYPNRIKVRWTFREMWARRRNRARP